MQPTTTIANIRGFDASKSIFLVVNDIQKNIHNNNKQRIIDRLTILAKSCFDESEVEENEINVRVSKALSNVIGDLNPAELDQLEIRNVFVIKTLSFNSQNPFQVAKIIHAGRKCLSPQPPSEKPFFKKCIEQAKIVSNVDYRLAIEILEKASFEERHQVADWNLEEIDLENQMREIFLSNRKNLLEILADIKEKHPTYSGQFAFFLTALIPYRTLDREKLNLNDEEKKQVCSYLVSMFQSIHENLHPKCYCELLRLWMDLQANPIPKQIFEMISLVPNRDVREQMILYFVKKNNEFALEDFQPFYKTDFSDSTEIEDAYWTKVAFVCAKKRLFGTAIDVTFNISEERRRIVQYQIQSKEKHYYFKQALKMSDIMKRII